nr:putative GH32 family protein [Sinella curviseta]
MEITTKYLLALSILCFQTKFSEAWQPDAQCSTQQHRLRYHFSPRENWSNDPNGMVYYEGVYHLFFQYHPESTQWGTMHWGHAVSSNMLNWEQVDIALYPDEHGTIYSGSSVIDFGNTTGFQVNPDVHPLVAIFTSAGSSQTQSIAFSNDNGGSFAKFEGNPVLSGENTPDFRDPKVFMDANTGNWVMVLAVGNRVEFYGSENLKSWTKLSEFGRDPEEGSHVGTWECPDMVELPVGEGVEKLWALIVSVGGGGPNGGSGTQYFVGNWDGTKFTTFPWQPTQWVDWGPDNYAGVTWSNDPFNRSIGLGWMSNLAYAGAIPTSTWRGQMTMPRQLSLRALNATANQYRVQSQPPQEMESLRNPLQHVEHSQEFTVLPQTTVTLTEQAVFRNPSMEIEISLEMLNEPQFSLCAYNSLGEEVCFGYNATKWFLDRTKSGNTGFNDQFQRSSFATAQREIGEEQVTIKMFLDTSSIEVFVDDGLTAMTGLFFPTEVLDQVYIHHWSGATSGATLKVKKLDIWGLVCTVQDTK